ncbi:DUF192 domain-containing protein [Nocardioides mesophilus]|uniref:DUF192 domain-containing protein n=1 Tax=Nocardioides mesophilus TaxID=433659 RepID=UPI001CB74CA7|nr:DUF192 domain-containing protein [Nocardioides mesophilus]
MRQPDLGRLYVDGREVAAVELARSNAQKRRGLLGRDGVAGGFVLQPCHQVHTFRMRFALDVAYLDRAGRVLVTRSMPPGRIGPLLLRSRSILEAEAGAFEGWGLATGSTVTWQLG